MRLFRLISLLFLSLVFAWGCAYRQANKSHPSRQPANMGWDPRNCVEPNRSEYRENPSEPLPEEALTYEQLTELAKTRYATPRPRQFFRVFARSNDRFALRWRSANETRRVWADIDIPTTLVKAILSHVQMAMDQNWGEFIISADLGHGHLYIPYQGNKVNDFFAETRKQAALAFQHKDVRILYHTWEFNYAVTGQSTPHEIFRHRHRTLVGLVGSRPELVVVPVDSPDSGLSGMREYSSFQLEQNELGCFSAKDAKGVEIRFDIVRTIPEN